MNHMRLIAVALLVRKSQNSHVASSMVLSVHVVSAVDRVSCLYKLLSKGKRQEGYTLSQLPEQKSTQSSSRCQESEVLALGKI